MRTPILIMGSPSAGGTSTSAARYAALASGHSGVTWTSSVSQSRTPFPISGTLKNLWVRSTNAPGGTGSYTFAVIKNGNTGSPEALAVTLATADTSGSDLADTVSIVGGTDDICIRCLPNGTVDAGGLGLVQLAMEFESTGADAGKSIFFIWHAVSTAAGFIQPGAGSGVSASEAPMQVPAPVACTLEAIACRRSAAPGTTTSVTYAIRSGGVDQISAQITSANDNASATGSAAVAAGALLSVGITTPDGTPVTGSGIVAVAYTPDTPDYAMQFGVWSTSPSNAVDAFGNACGRQGNGSAAEAEYYDIAPFDFTARNLFLVAASAPAGSASRTVILRDDGADTGLTCQLTTTTTNNEVSATAAIAAGSLINMKTTPANTPAGTTKLAYGWIADTGAAPAANVGLNLVHQLTLGVF